MQATGCHELSTRNQRTRKSHFNDRRSLHAEARRSDLVVRRMLAEQRWIEAVR